MGLERRAAPGQGELFGDTAIGPLGPHPGGRLVGPLGGGERRRLARLCGGEGGFEDLDLSDPVDTLAIVACGTRPGERGRSSTPGQPC